MFESLEMAPPDPILGLNEAFRNDSNPEKINLSVGVYKDDRGQTPTLGCVREAERRLVENDSSKSYLGIDGLFKKFLKLISSAEQEDRHKQEQEFRGIRISYAGFRSKKNRFENASLPAQPTLTRNQKFALKRLAQANRTGTVNRSGLKPRACR